MEILDTSRRRVFGRCRCGRRPPRGGGFGSFLLAALLVLICTSFAGSRESAFTEDVCRRIAEKIYENECGANIENLVVWNQGENFLSLGVGHFIWYPSGADKVYVESFQELVRYAQRQEEPLPAFTAGECPWSDREAFLSARGTPGRQRLEALMQDTFSLQTRFLVFRLRSAMIRIESSLPPGPRDEIAAKYRRLAETAEGLFAMVDYVNFKGEGLHPGETNRGVGWGLKQVLLNMRMPPDGADAVKSFAVSAEQVLERRVRLDDDNSQLNQWLPGWRNRVRSYGQTFF